MTFWPESNFCFSKQKQPILEKYFPNEEGETLKLDIDSKSHPAWIGGSQKILDKGRVNKFFKKFKNLRSTNKK